MTAIVGLDGEPLGTVERMAIETGDVIVIKAPGRLTSSDAARIRDYVTTQFAGHGIIVLGDGMTITAARPAELVDFEICQRTSFAGSLIGAPCDECRHSNLAHSEDGGCAVCQLLAAAIRPTIEPRGD